MEIPEEIREVIIYQEKLGRVLDPPPFAIFYCKCYFIAFSLSVSVITVGRNIEREIKKILKIFNICNE